jgi:heme-degrading monooxygenase HmoA
VVSLGDQVVEKRPLLAGSVFVALADIELKKGSEEEFAVWFSQSNRILAKQDGFIARKLLRAPNGSYLIMVIMTSKEAFAKMHTTSEHSKLHSEAREYMSRPPKISAYNSVP